MYIKEHQQLLSKYKLNYSTTKGEDKFEEVLIYNNLYYMKQKGFLSEAYVCFIADFYLPKPYKTIIEIDGSYHDTRVYEDKSRDTFFLQQRGIRTIRFDNSFVLDNSVEYLSSLLNTLLVKGKV